MFSHQGMTKEIVKRQDPTNSWTQCRGNRNILCIRDMQFTSDLILPHLSLKGSLYLSCCSRELNPTPASRNCANLEPLTPQPRDYLLDFLPRRSEPVPKFCGG